MPVLLVAWQQLWPQHLVPGLRPRESSGCLLSAAASLPTPACQGVAHASDLGTGGPCGLPAGGAGTLGCIQNDGS